MINRYHISCSTCRQAHTLRITLGYDRHQEHTFACVNCGEDIRVGLDLDFENRVRFDQLPGISGPRARFIAIENCDVANEEGAIVNLDPVLLIPERLRYVDQVFPWMYEAPRIGYLNDPRNSGSRMNDMIDSLGGERHLRERLDFARRAWEFAERGHDELCKAELNKFAKSLDLSAAPLKQTLFLASLLLLGQTRIDEIVTLKDEVIHIRDINSEEFDRFRCDLLKDKDSDLISTSCGIDKRLSMSV